MSNSKKLDRERLKGLLECSVCLEQFDNPKMLACTHEFCKLCIEGIAQFEEDGSVRIACPMRCEQKTNLTKSQTVDNLTASYNFKNVLEAFMEEEVENPSEEKMNLCSHTSKCRNKPITVYCCNQVMCEACYNMHKNNTGHNNNGYGKKKKQDSNNASNSSHDKNSCSNNKGKNSDNSSEDIDLHRKVSLGFNKRENKLMVVCDSHNTFCTSICSDKMLLCTYCEHRDSNHKNHTKTLIEKDIYLLKELLRIELNGRERLLKFRMMTEKHIKESREIFQETLRLKKDECLRLYSELLETEEKRMMDEFDQHCYDHIIQTDFDDNMSPECCKEMLLKHDIELFLEREHIFKEISKYPRCQFGILSSTISWEENSEYLSTSPLGEIRCWGSHEVDTIEDLPQATLQFEFKKDVKQDENDCTNNDRTAVQDMCITMEKTDAKEEVWAEDDHTNLDVALAMKSQGNEYFKKGWYQNAKDCYSKAIEYCPSESPERAVFYQNRAAAGEELGRDHLDDAISDCREALWINPKYIKALQRKARLHLKEGFEEEEEGLYDAIAAKYLDDPANRWKHDYKELLYKIGMKNAQKFVDSTRGFKLPITSYAINISLSDNNCDLFSIPIASKSEEDEIFSRIMEDLKKQYYADIADACTKIIDMNGKHKYRSMLLRGIIRFCSHDEVGAFSDFDEVLTHLIDDTTETRQLKVDAMVRRACLKACTGDHAGFLNDMNVAILLDHNNASIYHCRAKFGTEVRDKEEIIADYRTAIALDDSFVAPRLALSEYLSGIPKSECADTSTSTEKVGEILTDAFRLFPKNSEVCCAYAQYLFRIGKKADGYLKAEKAISLAPKGTKSIQRAQGYAAKAQMTMCTELGINGSAKLCAKALELDAECYDALGLVGEIKFKTCDYEEAVKFFQRTIECSPRRLQELSYTFSQLAECETRIEVLEEYDGETWLKRDLPLSLGVPEVWYTIT